MHQQTLDGMRNCRICHVSKPLVDFYERPRDYCKDCWKARQRARSKARSALKPRRTPESRTSICRRWIERNPHKRAAHNEVWKALSRGDLTKHPCEVCGNPEVEAHHDDYSKPLEVRWFCPKHHCGHHKKERNLPVLAADGGDGPLPLGPVRYELEILE